MDFEKKNIFIAIEKTNRIDRFSLVKRNVKIRTFFTIDRRRKKQQKMVGLGFFSSIFSWKNSYIPVSQFRRSLSCISMCSEGKQTDRQIDRHTVKKKNRRMSATTNDAMLRTRFVCYLYSFSLPFFFFDDADDGYTALQTNGRRMIFYLRHTREEPLICLYVCVLPCSDDDATEMKRVLRRGGTLQ